MIHFIRVIAVVIFTFFIPPSIFAKLDGGIKGVIKDGQKPIANATVSLLNAKDSSLVKISLTNEAGAFEIRNYKPGKYLILAQAINYTDYYSAVFKLDDSQPSYILSTITLQTKNTLLENVTVTTKKPFIEQKIDRTIINVANSITSAGSTAWELLQKSPGVSVNDNNNGISLYGKDGVVIFIDGKPTYMNTDQLASMLKSMNANNIQSIELMSHPPAGYDAAGTAGVINIITQKSKIKGLAGNLSVSYGQGIYSRQSINGNITYTTKKISVYGNLDYSDYQDRYDLFFNRGFYDFVAPYALISKSVQTRPNKSDRNNYEYKIGADYNITKNQTLNITFNGMVNRFSAISHSANNFLYTNNMLQSTVDAINKKNGQWHNNTIDANYKIIIDSLGKSLSADLAYTTFGIRTDQTLTTNYYDSLGAIVRSPQLLHGNLPTNINITAGRIDYTHPISKSFKIETGIKSAYVSTDNNIRYDTLANNKWQTDSSTSNHFKYIEKINAAYLNFSKEYRNGWTLQAGLRGEQTISKGQQITIDSTVKRNYFQMFPSVFIQKKLYDIHVFGIAYSRRINRPQYQDLNPFRLYFDPYTYNQGNPFLLPEIENMFSLSYAFKLYLNATLNYSSKTQAITNIVYQDNVTKISYRTQGNLNTVKNISLNLSSSIPITKWFTTVNSLNIFHYNIKGLYQTEPIDLHKIAFQFNTVNTFILPRNYSIELSGFYNSPTIEDQSLFLSSSMYQTSFGIQKKFLKNKNGVLKLNVQDPFGTLHFDGTLRVGHLIDLHLVNRWDNRIISLTFACRFNKGVKVKEHNNTQRDEQNRITK